MIEFVENMVIVLDTSNYKITHNEPTPFRAKVIDITENELWVRSLNTGKEYELYYGQVLEYCETFDLSTLKY